MDILVVSGCSGDKQFDEAPLGCVELDSTSRDDLLKTYPDYVTPAAEMYTGDEHERVRQAVANLRAHAEVTWRIVSTGYGLVAENERIVACDCPLRDIDPVRTRAKRMGHDPSALTIDETRQAVGRGLNLPADLKGELAEGYDLVFVTLSEPYLSATAGTFAELPEETTVFVFASKGSKSYAGDAYWVPATEDVRASLGTTWFKLREELLWKLSESVDAGKLAQIALVVSSAISAFSARWTKFETAFEDSATVMRVNDKARLVSEQMRSRFDGRRIHLNRARDILNIVARYDHSLPNGASVTTGATPLYAW